VKSTPSRRGTNSYPEGPERLDILVATPTGLQGTHSDDRAGRRQRQTQQWSRLPLVQSSQQTALGLCVNRILGPWHSRSRGRCSSLICGLLLGRQARYHNKNYRILERIHTELMLTAKTEVFQTAAATPNCFGSKRQRDPPQRWVV